MSIAKIHVAKNQLGMDDETYRALLARVAGVRSSKGLNKRQLGAVLAEFERLGFKPKAAKKAGRAAPKASPDRQRQIGKIEALLAEAKRPWAYVDAMALRMFKVARVEWCDADQLRRLITALTYDAERHGRPTE